MKMAVIGCGWAGRSHAVRGKELGLEVAGLCDIVEASAQKLSDEVGSGFVTTDPERIMGGKRVESGFIYSSDSNREWMKIEQLQEFLESPQYHELRKNNI